MKKKLGFIFVGAIAATAFLVTPSAQGGWLLLSNAVAAVWGTITGDTTDQVDLTNLLNAKAPAASPTFTGTTTFSSLTATTVPYLNSSKVLTSSAVTPTELGYISGVSSALQTQLGTKAPLASPAFTTSARFSYGTASTVPYWDSNKDLISSAVTPTELGYVSGVTSAIQTQFAAKAPLASPTFTGTVNAAALTCSGVIGTQQGSKTAVAIALNGDANTGFYSAGTDILGISSGGEEITYSGATYPGFSRGTGAGSVGGVGVMGSNDGVNANVWTQGDIFPRPGSNTAWWVGSYKWSGVHHLYPFEGAGIDRLAMAYAEGDTIPSVSKGTIKVKTGTNLTLDADRVVIPNSVTPASAAATCVTGSVVWDASYIYICTATDTWKRAAIATW